MAIPKIQLPAGKNTANVMLDPGQDKVKILLPNAIVCQPSAVPEANRLDFSTWIFSGSPSVDSEVIAPPGGARQADRIRLDNRYDHIRLEFGPGTFSNNAFVDVRIWLQQDTAVDYQLRFDNDEGPGALRINCLDLPAGGWDEFYDGHPSVITSEPFQASATGSLSFKMENAFNVVMRYYAWCFYAAEIP